MVCARGVRVILFDNVPKISRPADLAHRICGPLSYAMDIGKTTRE